MLAPFTRLLAVLLAAVPVTSAAFPDRPIRIVVPLPAGTAPDIFARHIGQKLSATWRQPVVIENRSGGNTTIGTGIVAKASPDGYTLLYSSVQHVMLKPLLAKLPFDPDRDFVPVTTTSATEMVLLVPAGARFATVNELVAHARAKPDDLAYSTPSIGSPAHLAAQAMLSATSTRARHIPMKGSTESVAAVAGSHVDFTVTAITNALPLIQAGRVKPLAVTGPKRHERFAHLPTMLEAIPPGFVYETWGAMQAPARTPREVLVALNREVVRILNEPDTRDFWDRNGSRPTPRSLEESARFIAAEARKAVELVKAIGATAQ